MGSYTVCFSRDIRTLSSHYIWTDLFSPCIIVHTCSFHNRFGIFMSSSYAGISCTKHRNIKQLLHNICHTNVFLQWNILPIGQFSTYIGESGLDIPTNPRGLRKQRIDARTARLEHCDQRLSSRSVHNNVTASMCRIDAPSPSEITSEQLSYIS